MIAMIILGALALVVTLGLAKPLVKDFKISAIIIVLAHLLVIGLNFIPVITWGGFSFRVGTMVFYIGIIVMFFIKGRFVSQMTAFSIALILGGLAFAGAMLSSLAGNAFFGASNYAYALIIGALAMALTRNGRYSFIIPAEAMMVFNIFIQIGGKINLDYGFDWTMVAVVTGTVLYLVAQKIFTAKPNNKMAYYFEAGRLL